MKRKPFALFLLVTCFLATACSSTRPQYETHRGKKKLKYYNSIQYR